MYNINTIIKRQESRQTTQKSTKQEKKKVTKETQNNYKAVRKMILVSPYILVITLNTNGLSSPI